MSVLDVNPTKLCRGCNQVLPVSAFAKHKRDNYQARCRPCKQAYEVRAKLFDPERYRQQKRDSAMKYSVKNRENLAKRANARYHSQSDVARRFWTFNNNLKNGYGIDAEDWARIVNAQCLSCKACGDRLDLGRNSGCHVDHCHATGRVRGVLCGACNVALGYLRECPERARRLAAYVETVCRR